MKLDQARIDALPEVLERLMKPTEKIKSIRVNQISGIGSGGTGAGRSGTAERAGGERSAVNDVIDGVLSLALQLPAVRKLGEEVGLNIADGIRGLSAPLDGDDTGGGNEKPPSDPSDDG